LNPASIQQLLKEAPKVADMQRNQDKKQGL
jgi:hypothetical protein